MQTPPFALRYEILQDFVLALSLFEEISGAALGEVSSRSAEVRQVVVDSRSAPLRVRTAARIAGALWRRALVQAIGAEHGFGSWHARIRFRRGGGHFRARRFEFRLKRQRVNVPLVEIRLDLLRYFRKMLLAFDALENDVNRGHDLLALQTPHVNIVNLDDLWNVLHEQNW